MNPSISYLIFVHNEGPLYLEPLFNILLKHKNDNDEIVVIDDFSDESSTVNSLNKFKDSIIIHQHKFEGDFSAHKNFGKTKCTKDFIFQIDADESPTPQFLSLLKEILINNPSVEVYWLPRVNIVMGLTQEDINRWGWRITKHEGAEMVQWPDYQGRIWKNVDYIKWEGKVHERLVGQNMHTLLPAFEEEGKIVLDYALLHIKDIIRQKKQNDLYNTIS